MIKTFGFSVFNDFTYLSVKFSYMSTQTFKHTAVIGILSSAVFAVSCGKEKTADDNTAPVISVHAPLAGDQFAYLDTVQLSADITDESEIKDVTVSIITPADTIVFWPPAPVIFGNVTTYSLDDEIINGIAVGSPTDVIMRFSASDKHDNESHVDVTIQLQ